MQVTKNRKILGYLACFFAAWFFAFELMQLHIINVLSSSLIRDLHLSASQFSILSSSYLLADVIFLIPAGVILDRFSVRKTLLFFTVVCILGTVGLALSTNFMTANIAHFVAGMGNAFCFLSCMTLATKWFAPRKRGFIMSVMITIGMSGAALAQWPTSLLLDTFPWRTILLIDAVIGSVLFVLMTFFIHAPQEKEKIATQTWQESFFLFIQAIKNPQNFLSGTYISLMNLPLMLFGTVWGSLFLKQVYFFSDQDAAIIIGMIATGTIFGSTFFGWLSNRIGEKIFPMRLGSFASLIILISIFIMPIDSKSVFSLLFFLLGFFTSSQVLGYPIITDNSPTNSPATSLGVGGVLVMGLPMLLQPFSGFILDLVWDQTTIAGIRTFSYANFMIAFATLPLGIMIAYGISYLLKEQKEERLPL